MLGRFFAYARRLASRRRIEDEVEAELQFHLEQAIASHLARGVAPPEARRLALRDLGGMAQTREAVRDARTLSAGLLQDARFAIRVLLKHRLSTTVTVLMLALGLGVNTAVFTAANAWLVSPYPYPEPDRLVMLEARHIKGSVGAHYRDVLDWRERNRAFEEIAIFWPGSRVLTGGAEPERVFCQITTAAASRVLRVSPVLGRFFTEQEDAPGGAYVALVSYSAWQRYFAGRRDIIGTVATLDGRPHTIIGVMPDRAVLPQRTRPAFWLPLRASPAAPHGGQQYYELMARLKPDVTLEQARANMTEVALALEREDPTSNAGWRVIVTSAQSSARERNARATTLLLVIAGCLLLLVCANVAGVLLVRSALRTKELAVRAALGAARWRLVRQVLVEGVLLGMVGGGLGLLVADWTLSIADAILPNRGLGTILRFDWPVLLFTAGVSMLTGLLFGLWPAFQTSNVDLNAVLKGAGIRSDRRKSRTRLLSGLVVVEVALAMALLVAGGLLTKDLTSLLRIDTGVKTEDVVTLFLRLPSSRYGSDEQRAAFVAQVIKQLGGSAGIDAVAAVGELPMSGAKTGVRFEIGNRSPDPGAPSPRAHLNTSSPGYFRVLGIRLLQGRDFEDRDRLGTEPVAIVSDRLARQYMPDRHPVGERLDMYGRSYTIVGVMGSVRHDGPAYEPASEIYLPIAQSPSAAISFVVRAPGGHARLMSVIRQRIGEVDPQLPVERLRTMDQVIHDSVVQPRLSAQVLAGFALFGLALALTGLYGVIAYSTEQRTREIAIRVSLGASSTQVLRLVLWHGVRLAALGLAFGVPLALGLSQVMKSTLATTSPRDMVVLTVVPVLLIVASLAATYIPARRATRIQPIVALRSE